MIQNTENIENNVLIVKYLSGEASKEDILMLKKWLADNDENIKLFNQYQKAWQKLEYLRTEKKINIDTEWKKIEKNIDHTDASKIISLKPAKPGIYHFIQRVAAIIIILLITSFGAYFIIRQQNQVKLITETSTKKITLPDKSNIALNANSKITYSKHFSDKTRKVHLNGEAYFRIEPNDQLPFIIETAKIYIEVLGTSFNVKAYSENEKVEVIVVKGKVAMYSKKSPDDKIILGPGNKGEYNKAEKKLYLSNNTDINFLAWKTKRLSFRNKKLSRIINTINDAYHVNIIISNEEIKNCRLTTSFDNQSLDAILNVLKAMLNIKVTRKGETIIISGQGCE